MPPITREVFMKDRYDFSASNCDIVRDILKKKQQITYTLSVIVFLKISLIKKYYSIIVKLIVQK